MYFSFQISLVHYWYIGRQLTFVYWPCIIQPCYNCLLVSRKFLLIFLDFSEDDHVIWNTKFFVQMFVFREQVNFYWGQHRVGGGKPSWPIPWIIAVWFLPTEGVALYPVFSARYLGPHRWPEAALLSSTSLQGSGAGQLFFLVCYLPVSYLKLSSLFKIN